jgi:hypothetical protein
VKLIFVLGRREAQHVNEDAPLQVLRLEGLKGRTRHFTCTFSSALGLV